VKLALFLAALFFSTPSRAEDSAGGGGGLVSVANGEMIFTAQPIQGGINGQIVVRRLSPDGGVIWEQNWGRGRGEDATSIATMPDGGVVVAGAYKNGCFAARFDSQGRVVWEISPNSTGLCRPAGVVADGAGAVYLLATVDGSAGYDAMVWSVGARGDVAWNYRHASNEALYAQNLYLDPRGDRLRAFVLRKRGTEFLEEFFRLDLTGRRL
jgi:hypothetical protein